MYKWLIRDYFFKSEFTSDIHSPHDFFYDLHTKWISYHPTNVKECRDSGNGQFFKVWKLFLLCQCVSQYTCVLTTTFLLSNAFNNTISFYLSLVYVPHSPWVWVTILSILYFLWTYFKHLGKVKRTQIVKLIFIEMSIVLLTRLRLWFLEV